jgi:hypothetical protein
MFGRNNGVLGIDVGVCEVDTGWWDVVEVATALGRG